MQRPLHPPHTPPTMNAHPRRIARRRMNRRITIREAVKLARLGIDEQRRRDRENRWYRRLLRRIKRALG